MSGINIQRTERGLLEYGGQIVDTYGGTIRVKESSADGGPFVWLFVDSSSWQTGATGGDAAAHLNTEQARGLIARLQAFVDGVEP